MLSSFLFNIKSDKYQCLIEYLEVKIFGIKDGNRVVSHKLITLKDFVPDYLTIDKLMMRFFITAKRCIEGENKELLFGSKDTDRIKKH